MSIQYDPGAAATSNPRMASELNRVKLSELPLGRPATNSVVYGTLVADSCRPATCVMSLFQCDDSRDIITLGLYNCVPDALSHSDVIRRYPKGLRLAIKDPYKKKFVSGEIGLRIDHLANLEVIAAAGASKSEGSGGRGSTSDTPAFAKDEMVQLHGLVGSPQFNGCDAMVLSLPNADGRYAVQITTTTKVGKMINVKPQNMRKPSLDAYVKSHDKGTADNSFTLKPCATCDEPGDKTCRVCRTVTYCSKACQLAHWQTHRRECRGKEKNDIFTLLYGTRNRSDH